MKQNAALSLLATVALAAACSSSSVSSGPRAKIIEPTIGIRQMVGPAELGYPEGPIEVKLEFDVQNNSSEPLTLRRVHVSTVNPAGGAYSLRPRDYYMSKTIAPNTTEAVEVWARGYGWGRGAREAEPVTLKGVAYFDSAVGYVTQPFMRELGQYPGQNDR
jgi:hypothetical protein